MKKNYTKKELSKKIYQDLGFSKNISSEIIDNFFNYLVDLLVNSKQIKISSFGTFDIKSKKERIGRNPKTKIEAKISARKVVKFTPSMLIKKRIND